MLSSTCVLRKMSAARLILACVAAVAAGSVPAAAYDEHYESQPANQHSTLIDRNQTAIRDDTFAGWIRNLVFTGGGLPDPRVRDATLLFNQCYGGGMLDDLITAFIPDPHSSQIAWVGGSAAKHDEQSWGQGTPLETGCKADNYYYVDEPGEYWTNPGVVANAVLVDQMDTCSRAMIDCVNNARANDSEGVNGNRQETGQSLCRNLGEYITVEDTRCTKHYAILFAGNTNGLRFYYDIKGVRDKLVKCWGQPGANVSITVLYGDGQHKTIGGSYNSQLLPAEEPGARLRRIERLRGMDIRYRLRRSDGGVWEEDVADQVAFRLRESAVVTNPLQILRFPGCVGPHAIRGRAVLREPEHPAADQVHRDRRQVYHCQSPPAPHIADLNRRPVIWFAHIAPCIRLAVFPPEDGVESTPDGQTYCRHKQWQPVLGPDWPQTVHPRPSSAARYGPASPILPPPPAGWEARHAGAAGGSTSLCD